MNLAMTKEDREIWKALKAVSYEDYEYECNVNQQYCEMQSHQFPYKFHNIVISCINLQDELQTTNNFVY